MKLNIPTAREFAERTITQSEREFKKVIENTINEAYENGYRHAYFRCFLKNRIDDLKALVEPLGYEVIKLPDLNSVLTELSVKPAEEIEREIRG